MREKLFTNILITLFHSVQLTDLQA